MMRKSIQLACTVSALAFLLLTLGAKPALAGDVDVPGVGTFGGLVATLTPDTALIGAGWTATLSEKVYLTGGGIYTYVFTVLNGAGLDLSHFATATVGAPNFNGFSAALNFGVVTGATFTTPLLGIDDSTGACTSGGFCFGSSSLSLVPTSTAKPGFLPVKTQITFYAQSKSGPGVGVFTALDGGSPGSGISLNPGPEPSSILLFGTGLLAIGMILRRQLVPHL